MRIVRYLSMAVVLAIGRPTLADETITVATYNNKFLDAEKLPDQGSRATRIDSVISLLDADVTGLQEIDDRAALEAIFDPTDWHLIIDNERGQNQDVAIAARRATLDVYGVDADFLFPDSSFNSAFPTFGGDPPDADDPARVGVTIAALFPNPPGTDAGHEEVHLKNVNAGPVDVSGWMLEDKAGNQFELSVSVPRNDTMVITLPANTLPLTITGDRITLTTASGDQVDEVEYSTAQAKTESAIQFQG